MPFSEAPVGLDSDYVFLEASLMPEHHPVFDFWNIERKNYVRSWIDEPEA